MTFIIRALPISEKKCLISSILFLLQCSAPGARDAFLDNVLVCVQGTLILEKGDGLFYVSCTVLMCIVPMHAAQYNWL